MMPAWGIPLNRCYCQKLRGCLDRKRSTYVSLDLVSVLLEQLPSENGVVEGDLGSIVHGEDVDQFEILDFDLEVVGDNVDRPEVVEIAASDSSGEEGKTIGTLYLH